VNARPTLIAPLLLLAGALACSPPAEAPGEDASTDAAPQADASSDVASADASDPADADAADARSLDPEDYALDAPGPFRVGYRALTATYTPFEGAPERTITVNVWYPTLDTSGPPTRYLGTFLDRGVILDAALAATPRASYPVHVHSHGDQGFGGSCSHTMRHFASHGWVTVAPDHTDNTIADNVQPREVAMYYWRPLDLSASLDALEGLPDDDPLAGKADTTRVLLSGYSFGAYTAWAAAGTGFDAAAVDTQCEEAVGRGAGACTDAEKARFAQGLGDPRVVAAVPVAGTLRTSWFGEGGHDAVDVPVLSISGDEDNPESHASQWERVGGDLDMRWLELAGGCHAAFSFGGCNGIDSELGFTIMDTYMLAFARKHVLSITDDATIEGLLSGQTQLDPAATLRTSP
jgi:predicted dienelactone hydrolase